MNSTTRGWTLIVSDDPALQRLMADVLRSMRFETTHAIDFHEASERIGERELVLVCVDSSLPRDSGFDVCEFVRADPGRANVQILVMSDRVTPEDMSDAEEVGANAFVRKPFAADLLESYVNAMLERRAASRPAIRELRPSTFPPPAGG